MDFAHYSPSTMRSAITCFPSYKLFRSPSKSFAEFPNYAVIDPNLTMQIALVLYYAQLVDQRQLPKEFFRLCKHIFETKSENDVSKSVVESWIRHSAIKLHRKREQIIPNMVTLPTQMLISVSHILLCIFDNLLQASKNRVSNSNITTMTVSHGSSNSAYHKKLNALISGNEAFSKKNLNCTNLNDIYTSVSDWHKLYISLPSKESTRQVSIVNTYALKWLRRFWVKFCYQPDPMNCINDSDINEIHYLLRSWEDDSCDSNLNQVISSCCSLEDLSVNNITSSISCTEDHDSSDSWSSSDFDDEYSTQDTMYFNSIKSHGISLEKCNSTLAWLRSTSTQEFSSDDDESIVFDGVITEENCHNLDRSKGSLLFIDDDSSDGSDFDVIFSDGSSANSSFMTDTCSEASQGYDNLCFEDNYSVLHVPKYIKIVNECWSEMMLDLKDKPQQDSKVSFAPDSSLVTVHFFEKTEENSYDATAIVDRLRFQRRINDLNFNLKPFFTCEHRSKIQQRNGFLK